jgi:hypothetical protein
VALGAYALVDIVVSLILLAISPSFFPSFLHSFFHLKLYGLVSFLGGG